MQPLTIDHSSKARCKDLAGWTIVAIQESRLLVRSYCSPSSVFEGTEQDKQGSVSNWTATSELNEHFLTDFDIF